jgi:hypothetical protein
LQAETPNEANKSWYLEASIIIEYENEPPPVDHFSVGDYYHWFGL